jgi:hypothetical protein
VNRRLVSAVWSSALEPGENRDAVATRFSMGATSPVAHVAVADGASRTLFSGLWAQTIVEAAVQGWPELGSRDLLVHTDDLRATFDPLTRYHVDDAAVQEKWMRDASQTTLVAATVTATEMSVDVSSVAVGDSVLMILDKERGTITFPPLTPTDFGRTPELITSRLGEQIDAVRWEGHMTERELLLLATDGAARPLMEVIEEEGTEAAWRRIAKLVDAAHHHGAADADLAAALLGDPSGCFQDDATLLLCAAVPDVADVSDVELLSAFMLGSLVAQPDTKPATRHRSLGLSGKSFSGWITRRAR